MHQARKRFGQHFLTDAQVIRDIVNAIDPTSGQHVVEIGPGLGAITLPVLERVQEMDAVEIDRDVIAALKVSSHFAGTLRLHEADVLQFDFSTLRNDGKLRVIGNLPYNISTPLLFHLIDQIEHIHDMHFMLQKEVVDRMAASPGGKEYGRLTVMLAPWVRIEPLFDIAPSAFRPPPKVMSTVVRLMPHERPPFAMPNRNHFAQVVQTAFSQRRKTLRNALQSLLDQEQIRSVGIDPGLRAEVLKPEEFAKLAALLAT
ncbi:MAG TPA: 16S rRNA (adenine(1518)-N(6)/adenine(1519)-N(6))-dimethyltransferase RsmA [Steroidobacteraceae bacterium]|nr:16S rRNA (adenine(1518)-N(6)/adenine(1519)-N(6))-dimethyltransferase RsmA [Steroidobacteraceae bacterium]